MIYSKINLKDFYSLKYNTFLEIFSLEIVDNKKRDIAPLALILPGGGYEFVSKREKDPVAIAFAKEGYISATLEYTVLPNLENGDTLYPHPHLEVMAAIDYLRNHAEEFRIDKDKIVLVGFSAGGHLAGSYGYLCKDKNLLNTLKLKENNVKPNYLVLSYPVISFANSPHEGSRDALTGKNDKLFDLLSIEKNITSDYPQTFIWNTLEDTCVPPINSNLIADALKAKNIPYCLKQYKFGYHGLSLIDKNTILDKGQREQFKSASCWFMSMIEFLDNQMKI